MVRRANPASDLPMGRAVLPNAVQRQRDAFGRTAIDPLLVTLRDRLAAVLNAPAEDAREAAHQLAGFAGVLGFGDLAEAWEGFSAEGESRRADAQRLASSTLTLLHRAGLSDGID